MNAVISERPIDRLESLINREKKSIKAFEKEVGISNGYIAAQKKGKGTIGSEVLEKILLKHPSWDLYWLVTGVGNVDLSPSKKEVIALGKKVPMRLKPEEFEDAFPDWPGVPVFNQPISASFVQHYRDEHTYEPLYHLRDPRFKDCNFAAIITGDSMHSEIRHGDYVVCKEITDRSLILFGDIYYVSTKNGMETCKYVNADPDDKHSIMLVPKNPNISPTSMKKSMIDRLYKVKGIIRGY